MTRTVTRSSFFIFIFHLFASGIGIPSSIRSHFRILHSLRGWGRNEIEVPESHTFPGKVKEQEL